MVLRKRILRKNIPASPIYEKSWFHTKWRPAMAWSYMVICLFDFFLAPIGISILKALNPTTVGLFMMWEPLTLKGGGLYHMAMLTIVGATAWGRSQEKIRHVASQLRTPTV